MLRIGRLGFGILVEVRLVTLPASFQVYSCPRGEVQLDADLQNPSDTRNRYVFDLD